jgi:hypothetical protein
MDDLQQVLLKQAPALVHAAIAISGACISRHCLRVISVAITCVPQHVHSLRCGLVVFDVFEKSVDYLNQQRLLHYTS